MNDETDIELPTILLERLQQQERRIAQLTPDVDRAIAAAAQQQFSGRRVQRSTRSSTAWGVAAAAAAALVFVVVTLRDPTLPGDYNGSGTVDVLDAFALSRELEQNPRFAASESVDTLMQRIVALDGSPQ